jgi:hypothetical protein
MEAPTMWQSLSQVNISSKYRFFVHLDRHLLEDLPDSDDELKIWLEDRWFEKGRRLENLRVEMQNGRWNGVPL